MRLLLAGPAAAVGCEELRSSIEAKITAAGVARFTLTIVDADAPAAGRVVGSCDLGRRKIVYQAEAADPAVAPAAGAAPRTEPVLTECRDDSVSMGGTCPR